MLATTGFSATMTRAGAWCALLCMPALAWACVRLCVDLASRWSPSWLIDDAMLLTAAAFAAAVATYLSVIGAAMVVTAVTGARRWARSVARCAPPSWQRVAGVAVGVGIATGVAAPSLAADDGDAVDAAAVAPQIAWVAPSAGAPMEVTSELVGTALTSPEPPPAPEPEPDFAATEAKASPTPVAQSPATASAPTALPTLTPVPAESTSTEHTCTVERGDSLWEITEGLLGPDASESEVALAWPELYAANRELVGADPGLIFAGQVLVVPASIS